MTAIPKFHKLLNIELPKVSKLEEIIIEADLFLNICNELAKIIRTQYEEFFSLIKLDIKEVAQMIDHNLIRNIINDSISTGEYTIPGLAYYANTSEDVISDLASGINTLPSLPIALRLIELHKSVRPKLYKEIANKIISRYSEE